eukprot:CAMPEP_0204440986 /NCGR_PEP_ID=MMETSP0470-20130426/84332_1 /ASSEMBLY_ACC=CAM_ASM_000385 /TAXON_ID=2969 /ORGANISM="Oxyrrhis marina" /LENGTH=74 /DNA_ID=CAMNT_0051440067 /DNA_START=302 /DNA_END=526 /DNA_ORIENTATION=-
MKLNLGLPSGRGDPLEPPPRASADRLESSPGLPPRLALLFCLKMASIAGGGLAGPAGPGGTGGPCRLLFISSLA